MLASTGGTATMTMAQNGTAWWNTGLTSSAAVAASQQPIRSSGTSNPGYAPIHDRLVAYQNWKTNSGIQGMPTVSQFRRFMAAHRPTSNGVTLFPANNSGYGAWISQIEAASGRTTYLYALYKNGEFMKWGITWNPNTRYPTNWMQYYGIDMRIIDSGPRSQMLLRERHLVKTQPGPWNRETWAGSKQ